MSDRIDRVLTLVYEGVNRGLTIDEAVASMDIGDQCVYEVWSNEITLVDYLN